MSISLQTYPARLTLEDIGVLCDVTRPVRRDSPRLAAWLLEVYGRELRRRASVEDEEAAPIEAMPAAIDLICWTPGEIADGLETVEILSKFSGLSEGARQFLRSLLGAFIMAGGSLLRRGRLTRNGSTV